MGWILNGSLGQTLKPLNCICIRSFVDYISFHCKYKCECIHFSLQIVNIMYVIFQFVLNFRSNTDIYHF